VMSAASNADAVTVDQGNTGASLHIKRWQASGQPNVLVTDSGGSGYGMLVTTSGTSAAMAADGGMQARGAKLRSEVAQLWLAPAKKSTHPTTGQAGDLFVDAATRLWFCKGGSSWHQLA